MKVCTDACIFGAWIANKVASCRLPDVSCLDIGGGTGLLSLMLAQKNPQVIIDAVEIEENAFRQAKENFSNSPWNNRLRIYHTDIKNFIPEKKYDLIICNPPFFENDLKSDLRNKNIAKHGEGLNFKELITIIKKNIYADGYFAILLSYHRIEYLESLAEKNNLFLQEKLLIKQTPSHNFFRGILFFGNIKTASIINELIIKNEEDNYTEEFMQLMKEYYLNL